MALLVSDTRQEDFSIPPPKKKWLQEYIAIEQDSCSSDPGPASSITKNLSTEAREFVRLFDNGTDQMINNNLKQLNDTKSVQGKMTLSQEVIGGVVQGVLDQFQTFFEAGCVQNPSQSFKIKTSSEDRKLTRLINTEKSENKPYDNENPISVKVEKNVSEENHIDQQDITPVVQSVISQFLNGSLADSDFRRNRKRSHKHINCNHKGDGSGGASSRIKRSSSVIKYKSREQLQSSFILPEHEVPDENGALNLSLPKPVPKVTFASRDRCYTTDSPAIKSFQTSKSEELSNLESLCASRQPHCEDIPKSLPYRAPCSLPVIRHTSSPHPDATLVMAPSIQNARRPDFPPISSGLPVPSPRLYPSFPPPSNPPPLFNTPHPPSPPPLEAIKKPEQISVTHPTFSFPVIKPRAIQPLLEPSSSLHSPQFPVVAYTSVVPASASSVIDSASKPVSTLASRATRERQENLSKEEIKRTSSSTREVHNRLEKNRRAHLKMCFDELAIECSLDPKKTSNLTVIRSAYKFTMSLKRKERENERNMANLVQEKIRLQQKLEELKREFPRHKSESDGE